MELLGWRLYICNLWIPILNLISITIIIYYCIYADGRVYPSQGGGIFANIIIHHQSWTLSSSYSRMHPLPPLLHAIVSFLQTQLLHRKNSADSDAATPGLSRK